MKYIDSKNLNQLSGKRLAENEEFSFDCYPGIACFNRCCHHLNLFLYPYDVIRLKNRLGISSDRFIDRYVDVVLRPGSFFPEVLLKMSDEGKRPCLFLTPTGCEVYPDRPDTCRKFPLEQGIIHNAKAAAPERVYFFRPPDFCLGPQQATLRTPAAWNDQADDAFYDHMTLQWAALRGLLEDDPWDNEGPEGRRAKMTFMACYNIDGFREFVFKSSFLKRYKVKSALQKKIRKDDGELLKFAFDWVKFFLWAAQTKRFRLR